MRSLGLLSRRRGHTSPIPIFSIHTWHDSTSRASRSSSSRVSCSPRIGYPGFVPNYPGPLPGGLRGDLTVQLRRCSITQIRDVFLSIEEPSETIEAVDGTVGTGNPVEPHAFTIGWFYDRIAQALKELRTTDKLTFGNLDHQVEGRIGPHHLYKINSLDCALQAIAEIQRQGEGNNPLNPDEGPDQVLSHFYKFSEIVYGRRIVIHDHSFSFDGEAIPFDPDGVYPMVDDPDTSTLTAGTPARILSEQLIPRPPTVRPPGRPFSCPSHTDHRLYGSMLKSEVP